MWADFLTADEAAALVGLKARRPARHWQEGNGPPCYKFGRTVRYRHIDVRESDAEGFA